LKKNLLLLILITVGLLAHTQQIKKMNADELAAFIVKAEKPIVISFWATWCGSCVKEIPYFISTIKEKYNNKVDILLVSLDIKGYYPKKIAAFAGQRNFSVPIVWLSESNADVFCPKIDTSWSGAIPSTLMLNNRKQYRKFYAQGLTPYQFEKGLKELLE
jgi:thiol-disulfide isomerase/thioredoxin